MEPLVAPRQSLDRARRILVAAAVIHLALFVLEARGTFAAFLAPRFVTAAGMTGPFAKGADWIGYYSWLRSPLIDGDFHFDNELAPTIARVPGNHHAFVPTATGHLPNPWPVGPAV